MCMLLYCKLTYGGRRWLAKTATVGTYKKLNEGKIERDEKNEVNLYTRTNSCIHQ